MMPQFGSPPVIETYPADPEPPSKSFQEAAFDFVGDWCRASRSFIREKTNGWKLVEALYLNQLGISDWQRWRAGDVPTSYSRSETLLGLDPLRDTGIEGSLWQSEYVHSPSYFVDNFTDHAFSQIFEGADYISIINESPVTSTTSQNSNDFSIAFKLQQLLINKLEQAKIHARLYEIIQSVCMLGTVFAKVFWYSQSVPKFSWQISMASVERITGTDLVYACPVIQIIPLDRILPDRSANHNDIQRWRGIGHTCDRTYEELLESFDSGDFNLNQKLFQERWDEDSMRGSGLAGSERLGADPDVFVDEDKLAWFQLWEWHGKIPHKGKQIECCCTIITEKDIDDPSDGVMVRLTTKPILDCGLRPFVTSHFIQRPGPFGVGLIEREEDLLYQLSQFVGQAQDIVRLSSNPIYQIDFSSPAYQEIKKNGGILSPGMVLPTIPGDPNSGLQAAKLPPYPTSEISNMVSFLSNTLERRTSVTDTQQGINERRKTATEASILQQQGAVPTRARVQLFARSFLEPAFNLALAMVQQFTLEDQKIIIRGADGQDIPLTITVDELQNGRFKAVATLLRQDHTTIAKAQSIERAMPILQNLQPILAQEGVQVSFNELITRFLELAGVDGADRIVRQRPPVPMAPSRGDFPAGPPPPSGMGPGLTEGPGTPFSPPIPNIPPPPRLVERGGPMGMAPTNDNAIAQLLQLNALKKQGGMP